MKLKKMEIITTNEKKLKKKLVPLHKQQEKK